MATPDTVDVAALLAPIPGGSPAGESLMFSEVFDKIQEARRGGDRSQVGGDTRAPDWRAVVRLAGDALRTRSKDLQIAVWLTDALARTQGFAGVRDGLRLLRELHETYWDTMHPLVEDGDLGFRAARLTWLNEDGEGRGSLAAVIGAIPLTDPTTGMAYGWLQYRDSRDVDNLARQSVERHQRAIAEGRLTGEAFDQAVAAGSRRFYEALLSDLSAAHEECTRLQQLAIGQYGADAPSLLNVQGTLEECRDLVERIVQEKRRLEPDPADAAGDGAGTAAAGPGGAAPRSGPLPSEPVDRADAIRRLSVIAAFFRRTEPHSPVAYLVQRAIRWAEMPLEDWLRDVVASEDVLARIRETLGIKPPG